MPQLTINITEEQAALIVAKLQAEQPEPLEGTNLEIIENNIKSELSVRATAAKQAEALSKVNVTPEEVK